MKRDSDAEPPSPLPGSRVVQNVYAVLRGTDPAQASRRLMVTGHYSYNSCKFNTHDPAPGANRDPSGAAAVLEDARVLSRLHLPSTILFVALSGEEHGLNSSLHLARLARAEGWDLEAVLNNDVIGNRLRLGVTVAVDDGQQVRIFSEGIPRAATPD